MDESLGSTKISSGICNKHPSQESYGYHDVPADDCPSKLQLSNFNKKLYSREAMSFYAPKKHDCSSKPQLSKKNQNLDTQEAKSFYEPKQQYKRKPISNIFLQSANNPSLLLACPVQHDGHRLQNPTLQTKTQMCALTNPRVPDIELKPDWRLPRFNKNFNSNVPSSDPQAVRSNRKEQMMNSWPQETDYQKAPINPSQRNLNILPTPFETNGAEVKQISANSEDRFIANENSTSKYITHNFIDTDKSIDQSKQWNTKYSAVSLPFNKIKQKRRVSLFEIITSHNSSFTAGLERLFCVLHQHYTPVGLCVVKDRHLNMLSLNIWQRYLYYQPQMKIFSLKISIWKQLQIILENHKLKHHYRLFMTGSTLSGLSISRSDVDISLVAGNRPEFTSRHNVFFHLQFLKHLLLNLKEVNDITFIEGNSPALRFTVLVDYPIIVEVNCNNLVAVANTQLLFSYTRCDWRLQPICSVVKQWTIHNNLNEPLKRALSSYTMTLLIIQFLQSGVSPPVLPCLHECIKDLCWQDIDGKIPADIINYWLIDWQSVNKMSLGELLKRFFKFYSEFNFEKYVVSVRIGHPVTKETYKNICEFNENDLMIVEEPFTIQNTSSAVRCSVAFGKIKKAFSVALKALEDTSELDNLFK